MNFSIILVVLDIQLISMLNIKQVCVSAKGEMGL